MFDGIPPARRRQMTERERKALQRMENAAWRAACDVWRAEQQARRLAKKFQRYAETVDRRLGPGGMFNTANKGSDLIGEWLVQEVSKAS